MFDTVKPTYKKIDINELPKWSPWPQRLLGLAEWSISRRTTEKAEKEYNQDKYAACLKYYLSTKGEATMEMVKQAEREQGEENTLCTSLHNNLFLMTSREARLIFYDLLIEKMTSALEADTTIIELGCGYGYNLWMLKQHFQNRGCIWKGGEYSANAVKLGLELFSSDSHINIEQFNFHDLEYAIVKDARKPVVIFTAHAIEQLPTSGAFFDGLLRYRDRIKTVFHFEPLFEAQDETLLGLMRRRYGQSNDYNSDLFSQLHGRLKDIRIIREERNVFGENPFNPTSCIQWEFI